MHMILPPQSCQVPIFLSIFYPYGANVHVMRSMTIMHNFHVWWTMTMILFPGKRQIVSPDWRSAGFIFFLVSGGDIHNGLNRSTESSIRMHQKTSSRIPICIQHNMNKLPNTNLQVSFFKQETHGPQAELSYTTSQKPVP